MGPLTQGGRRLRPHGCEYRWKHILLLHLLFSYSQPRAQIRDTFSLKHRPSSKAITTVTSSRRHPESAMSAQTQVYAMNGFSEHEAQDHFSRQFDLANPEAARHSYQRFVTLHLCVLMATAADCLSRIMHQHTKQQFEMATASSRRRSTNASESDMASLATESSHGSMSSTRS